MIRLWTYITTLFMWFAIHCAPSTLLAQENKQEPYVTSKPTHTTQPQDTHTVHITTKTGQVLHGHIIEDKDTVLVLKLTLGPNVTIAKDRIKKIEHTQEASNTFRNGRTRYLYAPSALMLQPGEWYFSQKELLFSSVGMGLHEHISLLAGAALPLWFVESPKLLHAILGLKLGMSVTDYIHLATGIEVFSAPFEHVPGLALPFAVATVGNQDINASILFSYPFGFDANFGDVFDRNNAILLNLSGYCQLDDTFGILTEHHMIATNTGNIFSAHALATRIGFGQGMVDLGFILTQNDGIFFEFPIPWVDFTWNIE